MNLTIEITRSEITRDLCARVVQRDYTGQVHRGSNLLTRRRLRKIESAKTAVLAWLAREVRVAKTVTFDVQASADTPKPYKHTSREQLQKELTQ